MIQEKKGKLTYGSYKINSNKVNKIYSKSNIDETAIRSEV